MLELLYLQPITWLGYKFVSYPFLLSPIFTKELTSRKKLEPEYGIAYDKAIDKLQIYNITFLYKYFYLKNEEGNKNPSNSTILFCACTVEDFTLLFYRHQGMSSIKAQL